MKRKLRISIAALVMPFTAALGAAAHFTLGVPSAPEICTDLGKNAWLQANSAYSAMSLVTPGSANAVSAITTSAPQVKLAAVEAGFVLERTKPEYYICERIVPPGGVDWPATYARFVADGSSPAFIFDPSGEAIYAAAGGNQSINWVLANGDVLTMSYIIAASCKGRPRRIYWTDEPFNAPSINLMGKFVKFFGDSRIITPKYSQPAVQGGPTNVIEGIYIDTNTHMLNACGGIEGQVVMVYYDTGTYENLLHVQAVEVCRPQVNVLRGEIGRALRPDGRGYDTSGLRARPTPVSTTDDRGDYLYQHKGQYSYSPKSGNVYPLRPTKDCRWNAEVYWMETDEMEVQWPFELDHYECDWPKDATVFVRGDLGEDSGRPIYIPSDYTATLMSYQEPEGHARAPEADGTFRSVGEGYSLLRINGDDNIWFLPIHSVMRSNTDYFTLAPADVAVGSELRLREGADSGTAPGFSPSCDPASPGSVYEAASARIWNPNLYLPAKPDSGESEEVDPAAIAESGGNTNAYESVIYAVTANAAEPKIEVWWNTTIQAEDMPAPIEVPTLPQVYSVHWPKAWEAPQIAIASQLGGAGESYFSHNRALALDSAESMAKLDSRPYFSSNGGTLTFWVQIGGAFSGSGTASLLTLSPSGNDSICLSFDLRRSGAATNLVVSGRISATIPVPDEAPGDDFGGWVPVALSLLPDSARVYIGRSGEGTEVYGTLDSFLGGTIDAVVGSATAGGSNLGARTGVSVGELTFWSNPLDYHASGMDVATASLRPQTGTDGGITGLYSFRGEDKSVVSGSSRRYTFTEKVLGVLCTAENCTPVEKGPPLLDTAVIKADAGFTPRVYVQNDPEEDFYNPNEEHGFVRAGSGGYVAWALRTDLNNFQKTTSEPGVLVEYVSDGRKAMQWYSVVVTSSLYPELAADCEAGKALPGPHPLDLFDDPWRKETKWVESSETAPGHRDRKGQLWARAAGNLTVRMFYPMQEGFAYPSLKRSDWPAVGTSVSWLPLLNHPNADPVSGDPVDWLWRISWPANVPEMEIGRTLTLASSGLPEVWNAKSVGVVWPATDRERGATAVLFDPTVAQSSGFPVATFATVTEAVAALGIRQGKGGNGTLRKGKWTFDGLPPSIASRFYLDTTEPVTSCLKLVGEMEDNPGGVSLLHVNVLNDEERKVLRELMDSTATDSAKDAWHNAIDKLATSRVEPSPHVARTAEEESIDYVPRDHYALFSMGATNYVTIIENDSTHELMNVSPGDPIQMHVIKVVPKYYVGRVVTREDPLNLLSQQLSVVYAEAFAGSPEDYVFEWKKCQPRSDGVVPTDFEGEYTAKFEPTAGLTRFVIGGQGDTLANMVNTYYAMRYRAANENSPAYAAMGSEWSAWTDPPALAEGWVQRVLNNVTPFTQRMRDLVENEAETAVSMIRQAGAPYEGDVALNQDNLKEVGLIQLYETLLSKAESMSLQLGINDADANKQLQLAVARLADLYNLLGDEAYTDALNPTVGFGPGSLGIGPGYLDYGALSSSLFCFDNQMPTLLDEELALLRGRTQEMAPSTHLSPYFNRLVWNYTRGMNAGEVAYAMNYDVSGNGKGVIDYSQAAEMYPQGHGDAYGHYLSALSGYYRLMRNPYFSWGRPAMGEMVVADAVVNVDYYDEAQFAKTAYNVAKTALEVVDRTARKAYRDNGGTPGAGYVDSDSLRNFGYGEWASRGGYGALCNWAVGNSLLGEKPIADNYYRMSFTDPSDRIYTATDNYGTVYDFWSYDAKLKAGGTWTIEFQFVADSEPAPEGRANLMTVRDFQYGISVSLDSSNVLSVAYAPVIEEYTDFTYYELEYWRYPEHWGEEGWEIPPEDDPSMMFSVVEMENESMHASLRFFGKNPPRSFPAGFDITDAAGWPLGNNIPEFEGWTLEENDYVDWPKQSRRLELESDETVSVALGEIPSGESVLVAIRSSGGRPMITVFDASGAKLVEQEIPFDIADMWYNHVDIGGGYIGEIGEFRTWNGVRRSDEELLSTREFVNPMADGLFCSLRTISKDASATRLTDDKLQNDSTIWVVVGGEWLDPTVSGINIAFTDDGLKRIDRTTVPELASLAGVASQIQKKVDLMDAGLNPLGLSESAIPFDITPVGMEDGTSTHFEQIRGRAGTALANAKAALDKAQESAGRMRMLQDAAVDKEASIASEELAFKNRMIEYFGYPYAGDIGPSGTYPQGYDGPDVYHYAWMDPKDFGMDEVKSVYKVSLKVKKDPWGDGSSLYAPADPVDEDEEEGIDLTFEMSANGMVLKPDTVRGRRLAQGKIQDALAAFFVAYAGLETAVKGYEDSYDDFETAIAHTRAVTGLLAVKETVELASITFESILAAKKCALGIMAETADTLKDQEDTVKNSVLAGIPKIMGAGMTVNTDPNAIASIAVNGTTLPFKLSCAVAALNAKNALTGLDALETFSQLPQKTMEVIDEITKDQMEEAEKLGEAVSALSKAGEDVMAAYRSLQIAQAAVETVVAEAQRVIDERTLMRSQAVDAFTQARYGEMFFRIQRDNALSRYSSMFDLAQKYAYLAAQAYDYETGLLSADRASGESYISRIVGARTLGEFDGNGNPIAATGAVKGDGGLADILAEMDANWLVLKPRLGINNPQPYATWFSLRHDLFRIFEGEDGDRQWKTELQKHLVDDLNALPEFRRYCQPLSGSTAAKEPGIVIPFSSAIAHGYNFFGQPLTSGDTALDPTYYATHIASAGVHFENYDRKVFASTPVAYLVPVGEDRMRAVGDQETVLSWKVVDQTIPAPFAIGSTKLDDPDWTPLFNGDTGGNDVGARIRRHPSFRAYYGGRYDEPGNDSLDCTRLIGRSAWNTKWLLIIPAGSMNSDREAALAAFIGGLDQNRDGVREYEGVSDIKIGLKTYSASGN